MYNIKKYNVNIIKIKYYNNMMIRLCKNDGFINKNTMKI